MALQFKTKRRISFAVINFFMFLNGIEYAVIFPTLWEYLRTLGVAESEVYYLGLCISAVTMTDMFMGLIVGRMADKFSKTLCMVLVLNIFQIGGSFLYFCGVHPNVIFISRLIEGLGSGVYVAFLTDVCRSTSLEERTPALLLFNVSQQLGLLLGPACNLFLQNLDFFIGPFHVTKLNAPGLLLTALYITFEIVAATLYYDLAIIYKEEQQNHSSQVHEVFDDETVASDDTLPILSTDEVVHETRTNVPWSQYVSEIIKGEMIALIFLRFIGLFGQTCLETVVTPMMKTYFNYGDFANSILYLAGGGELIVVFVLLTLASKKVSDRALILAGILLHIVAYIWFIVFVPQFGPGDRSNLVYFAVGTVLDLASIPILLDISLALYSKLLTTEVQGFAHGIRRFIGSFALLTGPLWGSGSIHWLVVLFAIPLSLLVIALVMFSCSYSQMKPLSSNESNSEVTTNRDEPPTTENELNHEEVINV